MFCCFQHACKEASARRERGHLSLKKYTIGHDISSASGARDIEYISIPIIPTFLRHYGAFCAQKLGSLRSDLRREFLDSGAGHLD